MAKVHPKTLETGGDTSVLTVWKKSLMFNCNGFTVFDSKGDLIFRVDNYMHARQQKRDFSNGRRRQASPYPPPQEAELWRYNVEAAVNGEEAPQHTKIEDIGLRQQQHQFQKNVQHPRIIRPAMLCGVRR